VPDAGFFARLGVFVARGFLDPETCARLRSEASSGRKVQAAVTSRREVDLETRRTQVAGVPPEVDALVADPLEAMLPEIGRHFSSRLDRHEALQFLVYEKGDFFEPHQDASAAVEGEDSPRRRRVSVVIFLNSEGDDPGPDRYGGGALTFYGLLGEAGGEEVGLPLVGEEGLLVAFRSEITHGVTPVTHGSRYTVVTWLR
jgi:predicted 2-oxoglutarate/Fe(II)-dependent dioxygenase YbiX